MSGGTLILHSTVGPEDSQEIAKSCPAGLTFIDAPVTVRRSSPPTLLRPGGRGAGA